MNVLGLGYVSETFKTFETGGDELAKTLKRGNNSYDVILCQVLGFMLSLCIFFSEIL